MSPVVAFHDLGSRSPAAITGISEAQFRAHIDALIRLGTRFRSLKQWMNESQQPNDILLTLDDAFARQLEVAQSILQPLDLPALALVVTGTVGQTASWDYAGRRRRHANVQELRAWTAAGFEVGSHGHTHRDLCRLPDALLYEELRASRQLLQQELSVEVRAIAYPFGRSDGRVRKAAMDSGYQLGFGTYPDCGQSDPMNLPRILVSGLDTPVSVASRMAPGLWGRIERGKQRIVSYCAAGTPLWQQLRGDYP